MASPHSEGTAVCRPQFNLQLPLTRTHLTQNKMSPKSPNQDLPSLLQTNLSHFHINFHHPKKESLQQSPPVAAKRMDPRCPAQRTAVDTAIPGTAATAWPSLPGAAAGEPPGAGRPARSPPTSTVGRRMGSWGYHGYCLHFK